MPFRDIPRSCELKDSCQDCCSPAIRQYHGGFQVAPAGADEARKIRVRQAMPALMGRRLCRQRVSVMQKSMLMGVRWQWSCAEAMHADANMARKYRARSAMPGAPGQRLCLQLVFVKL